MESARWVFPLGRGIHSVVAVVAVVAVPAVRVVVLAG
jgi:hypothetical protein